MQSFLLLYLICKMSGHVSSIQRMGHSPIVGKYTLEQNVGQLDWIFWGGCPEIDSSANCQEQRSSTNAALTGRTIYCNPITGRVDKKVTGTSDRHHSCEASGGCVIPTTALITLCGRPRAFKTTSGNQMRTPSIPLTLQVLLVDCCHLRQNPYQFGNNCF